MRIAQVTDWFLPRVGGIESHVGELTRRLRCRGLDAEVVTPWPGPEEVEGAPARRLALPRLPILEVAWFPGFLNRVERMLAEGRYDLLHAHVSIGSPVALASVRAGIRLGIPVLITFHSIFGRWGALYVASKPIFGWSRWPFGVSAVSPAVERDLEWIMPGRAVATLPCAVDETAWKGLGPEPIAGRLRLVTTSRLHRRKRVEALVRIVHEARTRVAPHTEVTLEIVGDGTRRRAVERLAGRLGMEGSVRLLGAGDRSAVRALLARGDVFVNACALESFGIAALEALAAGLPVVARSQSGVVSFVEDGVNGRLVDSDDAMVEALADLAGPGGGLGRLREGAARGIPHAFTWDGLVDRHLESYAALGMGGSLRAGPLRSPPPPPTPGRGGGRGPGGASRSGPRWPTPPDPGRRPEERPGRR